MERLGQRLVNNIRLTNPDFVCPEVFYMEDVDFLDIIRVPESKSILVDDDDIPDMQCHNKHNHFDHYWTNDNTESYCYGVSIK